mmetsp:Transcript_21516/g.29595  ORF Transcript_21516/g.29595 Transcript_21516/m.29595 type:complete len:214 (-) Transcript_21516:377-1018(-)
MSTRTGRHEGRDAVRPLVVGIRLAAQQVLHYRQVPFAGRQPQRGHAGGGRGVYLRARRSKELHDGQVAPHGGLHQRRDVVLVLQTQVRLGRLHQVLHHVQVALARRRDQRREVVPVTHINWDRRRLAGEKALDGRQVVLGRRVDEARAVTTHGSDVVLRGELKGQSRVAFVALDHNGSGALSFYTIFVAILSKDISCLCITKYIPFLCTAMAA